MGTLWVRYLLPLVRPLLMGLGSNTDVHLRGETVAEERRRELAEVCCRAGWSLKLVSFPGYWSFNRERGNSRICFQLRSDGRVTIKFVTREDVVGRDWGLWHFAGYGSEGPNNYYVFMDAENERASVMDLLPLLQQAWDRLQELP